MKFGFDKYSKESFKRRKLMSRSSAEHDIDIVNNEMELDQLYKYIEDD